MATNRDQTTGFLQESNRQTSRLSPISPLNPGTIGQAGIAAATINSLNSKNIFFIGLVIAASGLISTPLALLAGLIYGLSFPHPYHIDAQKLSAFLLKASIVGLGFGMNLHEVVRAGRSGFLYTALSISFALPQNTVPRR
jgi:uncharacterized membrane protein YadS